MAAWLTHGDAPGRFMLGEDLELSATTAMVHHRYARHPLETAEVRNHLVSGSRPPLGLTWNGRIAFLLPRPHVNECSS